MDTTEVENAVREIIDKHLDTSTASLEYKADVAKAESVMAAQVISLLQGTPMKEYKGYDWFSLADLDYHDGNRNEYMFPELIISYYEDRLIARNLLEYVESIHPEVIAELEKNGDKCIEYDRKGYLPSGCLRQLFRGPDKKLSEEEARNRVHALETELGCLWSFEKAQLLYDTLYQLTQKTEEDEYEARRAAEELYHEYCQETERPFIVLPDFFYDLRKYTMKHIKGYRYETILEKCLTYTDRYRTPVNAWFWRSIEIARALESKYRSRRVGLSETGSFGPVVLPFFLFEQYLALMKFRCDRLQDDEKKHQEVMDFVNYQYSGYPEKTYLGYPHVYQDICSYIGVKPVNLAEYEEEEKILVKKHLEAKAEWERQMKKAGIDSSDTGL